MDPFRRFTIPILGLHDGFHHFEFELDRSFFAHFEVSLISEGNFKVGLDLDKRNDHSTLVFQIVGKIPTSCDRCLAKIELPIKSKQTIILKRGEGLDEDPDLVYMKEDAHEFNVAGLIFEYICLSVPIVKKYDCEKEKQPPCNQDVLAFLQKEETDSNNDVWGILKNIKDFD